MTKTLTRTALNRALLARQWLLARQRRSPAALVEHLVGMQAQEPENPYVAMWSRLERFAPPQLAKLLTSRRAVRMTMLRGTLHLVSADDARTVRPLVQPVLDRMYGPRSMYGKQLDGIAADALAAAGRAILDAQPRSTAALARAMAERFPGRDEDSLAHGVRAALPIVQVTPRGVWGVSHPAIWAPLATWLGDAAPIADPAAASLDALVLRYLAAFGPASVNDMQNWSGLTRLREVFERLREELVTFRCPRGRELFDLPRAPRPPAETPAPPRFLPEFDNVLLGHEDRSRLGTEEVAARIGVLLADNRVFGRGFLLVDGTVAGMWKVDRERAVLDIEPLRRMRAGDRDEVAAEGARLLELMTGEERAAKRAVRFARFAA